MSLSFYIRRIERLDQLIRAKATGTPKELSERLGISERTWYNLRDELIHDFGFPIAYCRRRRTYYYSDISFKFQGIYIEI